jgi:hypothetical protein
MAAIHFIHLLSHWCRHASGAVQERGFECWRPRFVFFRGASPAASTRPQQGSGLTHEGAKFIVRSPYVWVTQRERGMQGAAVQGAPCSALSP